jgi:hypothetical protein
MPKQNESVVEAILRMVKEANGIKDRELCFVMRRFYDANILDSAVYEQVEKLISEKQLIAIEYSIDYTSVRNFLLPANTSFIVRGQTEKTHRI